MATCTKCGREFCEDELFELDGELLCEDCAEESGYARCRDCGEWFVAEDGYEYDGEPLCESCYEDYYCMCEDCGEVICQDDAVVIHDWRGNGVAYVCEDCADRNYYQCDDCGEYFTEEAVHTDGMGHVVCDQCFDWHGWHVCDDCGVLTQDGEYDEDDVFYCPDCYPDRANDRVIHDYCFKPSPEIRRRMNELVYELTFGLELEVDSNDNSLYERAEPTAQAILDMTDRVYMKHDGSLSNGFEIVSHPGTLAHHMYEMPWKGICSKAVKAGFRSHDVGTCGLHIHVGREGLGRTAEDRDNTIRKVIILMNRYWNEVTRFTRREAAQLNRWAELNYVEGYRLDTVIDDNWAAARIPTDHNIGDRYKAVNCNNRGTIEFRIFRGTLKRDTIIASIQLCWNFCQYAMSHSWDEIQSSHWLDVAQYKHWNELDAYLAIRGLAPAAQLAQNTNRVPSFGGTDGI